MKTINEESIKKLVQIEINECFKDINRKVLMLDKKVSKQSSDITEIKKAILGNKEYKSLGLVEKTDIAYSYVKRNTDLNIIKRAIPAIDHFEDWDSDGTWKSIKKALKDWDRISWFTTFLGIGSLAGIISFIGGVIISVRFLMEKM